MIISTEGRKKYLYHKANFCHMKFSIVSQRFHSYLLKCVDPNFVGFNLLSMYFCVYIHASPLLVSIDSDSTSLYYKMILIHF